MKGTRRSSLAPDIRPRAAKVCVVLAVAMLGAGFLAAPGATALNGLTTGFSGDDLLNGGPLARNATWLDRAASEGAGMVRVSIVWWSVAPLHRPSGFQPSDPASPGYNWTTTDARIRAISAHGLRVLADILYAPRWAEGPRRPPDAPAGTWRPNPVQFAAFARAAARRYSGTFPDPLHPGKLLPRVTYWQAWNEPNLYFLSPQWVRTRTGWSPASPGIYRAMLNDFYAAVKSVSASNVVLMAATAPYGDPPGGARMRPVQFYRALFCLNGSLKRVGCPGPVHLDAVDNHPYELSAAPTHRAYWPDDVAVPDVWKITRVLHAAEQAGTVLPGGHKQVWATELIWDSEPPSTSTDVSAVPLATQALYLEQAMYLLWRQGVDTVLWYSIRDDPPVRHYLAAFDWGGLYYYSGAPKPAATAFRFPFVTHRIDSSQVQAWGRAPSSGLLTISRRLNSGGWEAIASLPATAQGVFLTTLRLSGMAVLRAQVGSSTSLPWTQGA